MEIKYVRNIDKLGRVTIPKEIRDVLKINKDSYLEICKDEKTIRLTLFLGDIDEYNDNNKIQIIPNRKYEVTKEQLIENIKLKYKELGRLPSYREVHNPSVYIYKKIFGSWGKAIKATGIKARPKRNAKKCRFSKDEIIKLLHEQFVKNNSSSSNLYNKNKPLILLNSQSIRKIFKIKWSEIVKLTGFKEEFKKSNLTNDELEKIKKEILEVLFNTATFYGKRLTEEEIINDVNLPDIKFIKEIFNNLKINSIWKIIEREYGKIEIKNLNINNNIHIKTILKNYVYSMSELANLLGVSKQLVANWLKHENISVNQLKKISKIFKIDKKYIIPQKGLNNYTEQEALIHLKKEFLKNNSTVEEIYNKNNKTNLSSYYIKKILNQSSWKEIVNIIGYTPKNNIKVIKPKLKMERKAKRDTLTAPTEKYIKIKQNLYEYKGFKIYKDVDCWSIKKEYTLIDGNFEKKGYLPPYLNKFFDAKKWIDTEGIRKYSEKNK